MKIGRYLLAVTALLLAGCGADDPQIEAGSPTSAVDTVAPVASVLDATETPTTTEAAVIGLPPVTFVGGGSTTTTTEADDSSNDRGGDRATDTSTTVNQRGSGDAGSRTSTSPTSTSTTTSVAGSLSSSPTTSTTSTTTTVLDANAISDLLGDIDTVDDLAELFPIAPPVDGESTAIRITASPTTGLSSGDIVTIEAENLPAGQFLASAQCDILPAEAIDLGALLEGCNGFGFGIGGADGTGTFTVRVAEVFGNTDCRIATCYVGIAVLPGTADYVAFAEITFG